MNKQPNWTIRQYQPGDEEQIFQLRDAVRPEVHYNKEKWLRWWHWMYQEIPGGSKIWLAESDGKIVGLFTLLFSIFKIGNKTAIVAQSIDESTHPDYRRQGIMTTLQKHVLEEESKNGVNIFFGFPTDMAYHKDLKLGYFEVADMKQLYKVINWNNALKTRIHNNILGKFVSVIASNVSRIILRSSKLPVDEDRHISQISSFDERVNDFWERISDQFQICAIRNRDYLNWRYSSVPDIKYKIYLAEKFNAISGYLVLRSYEQSGKRVALIYELLAETEESSQCLLQTAIDSCRKENIDYIYWNVISHKRYLQAFKKRGFFKAFPAELSKFLVFSQDPDISREFLSKPEHWLIQQGDSDIL